MPRMMTFRGAMPPSVWVAVVTVALGAACGDTADDPGPPRRAARLYAGRPLAPVVQLPVQRSVQVFPADPGRLKEVQLDAMNGLLDLGPEGKLVGWSFGGQIPGPTVRVRVGDRVRFTITNRTDEPLSGLSLERASPQFEVGGLIIDRQDERKSIAPGQTLEVEGTAMTPGIHLYRGRLARELEAQAAGLYGMLIIDPLDGYPSGADREYAVIQGEIYTRADPAGRRLGPAAIKILDPEALTAKRPTRLGYGGQFTPGVGLRLVAQPGERLRLFVLNAGPQVTARFQIPGLPFDSVWPVEVLGTTPSAKGPAILAPGAGAVIEVVVPRKGRYRFQDQQLASQGLIGTIDAAEGEPETPLVAAKPRNAAERRERARELFAERCISCHEPPRGTMRMAPDLAGVVQRRSRQWLVSWLTDPPKMQAQDPTAQELLKQWNFIPMPQVMLSPEQIDWMLELLGDAAAVKKL